MRLLLILLFACCTLAANAQADDGEEPMQATVLALDTNVNVAKRFCEAIGSIPRGYALAFVDNETRYAVRYVFKNENNESLRVDYRFTMKGDDDHPNIPKRAVVTYQRISGELTAITGIYNFLFKATLTPERVMSSITDGSRVKYGRDKFCEFIFKPDEYEPGYWTMTFVR